MAKDRKGRKRATDAPPPAPKRPRRGRGRRPCRRTSRPGGGGSDLRSGSGGVAMKVLISWSGEASKQVALQVRQFVKRVIQATDPWMSAVDISAGSMWPEELWKILEVVRAGIVCLTPDNLESRWIHFEAGALAQVVGKKCVCPLLHGLKISDVKSPLSFLMCELDDEQGLLRVMQAINGAMEGNALSDNDLKDSFDAHYVGFKKALAKIPPSVPKQEVSKSERRQDILEEILAIVRELRGVDLSQLPTKQDLLAALSVASQRSGIVSGLVTGDPNSGVVFQASRDRPPVDTLGFLSGGVAGIPRLSGRTHRQHPAYTSTTSQPIMPPTSGAPEPGQSEPPSPPMDLPPS